jgi:simple sugar transport system permease protein
MTMPQQLNPATASGDATAAVARPKASSTPDDRQVQVGRLRRIFMSPEFGSGFAALVVFVGFALWGCIARGQSETNTFGPPVAA